VQRRRHQFVFLALVVVGTLLTGCASDGIRDDVLREAGSTLADASGHVDGAIGAGAVQPIESLPVGGAADDASTVAPPPSPVVQASSDVVVFVHGWNSTSDVWDAMRRDLANRGFTNQKAIDLPERGLVRPIPHLAETLAETMDDLARAGVTRVHLVAHSMGGLVCRDYLRSRRSDHPVAVPTLVTIATPHHGTQLFTQESFELLGCTPRMQMNPDSDFLRALNGYGIPAKTRVVSVWTPEDEIVAPPTSCILPGASNYEVRQLGASPHSALLHDERVFELVHAVVTGNAA